MVVLLKRQSTHGCCCCSGGGGGGAVLQTGQQGADWILGTLHTPDTGNPHRRAFAFYLGEAEEEYVKLRLVKS